MNQTSRAECIVFVARELGIASDLLDHCRADGPSAERFLLVQRNVGGSYPPFWLTTHPSPSSAGAHLAREEAPEDWSTVVLVDLDTGARMVEGDRILIITWEPVPIPSTEGAAT